MSTPSLSPCSRATVVAASLGGLLAIPLLAAAEPSSAFDRLWPDETHLAVIARHPGIWADLLDTVEARFGKVPSVASLVERTRALSYEGLTPGSHTLGPGLDPSRGAAFFITARGSRFVVGATDPVAAQATLSQTALWRFLVTEEKVQPACRGEEGFVVCDVGAVTGRSQTPTWAAAPPEADLWFWADGVVAQDKAPGIVAERLTAWLSTQGDTHSLGLKGQFQFKPTPPGLPVTPQALYGLLQPARPAGAPTLVDASVGAMAKFDVDLPGAVRLFHTMGSTLPPPADTLLTRAAGAFTGQIVVTHDGGLAHPVVLLGLTPGKPGDDAVGTLVAALSLADVPVKTGPCADAPSQICLDVRLTPDGNAEGTVEFRLHTARAGDTLVVALTAPDAGRRTQPDFKSAPWPSALEGSGRDGFTLPAFPGFVGLLGTAPFLVLSPEMAWALDVQTVWTIAAGLISDAAMAVQIEPNALSVIVNWRTL